MIIVISIENTLAQGPDLRTAAAYRQAHPLYEVLKGGYQLIGLTKAPVEIAKWWLKREHMNEWANLLVYDESTAFTWTEWKVLRVREFLSEGWEVAFYIDMDWGAIHEIHAMGVSTVRIDHAITRPGWQDPSTTAPRPWGDVAATVEMLDTGGEP